jgi:hypothetical protein
MGLAGVCVSTCALNEIEEPLHPVKKKKKRPLPSKRPEFLSDTLCNISIAPISFFAIFFSLAQEALQPKQKKQKHKRMFANACRCEHAAKTQKKKWEPVNTRKK